MMHQFKKKFGQNFLTDKNMLIKIVDSAQIENKNVIEIGPGKGALTNYLVEKAKFVFAYEIDESLKPFLDEIEKNNNNITVYYEDFLNTKLQENEYHIVANIPYNITSPILFKIFENDSILTATIMIQKEVADRILAIPKTKEYNALSVLLQLSADIKRIFNVDKKLFYPVPKVDSTVIRISKNNVKLKEEETIFIKNCFMQKRKTILNNIFSNYEVNKDVIEKFLIKNNINPSIRAEALSKEELLKLARAWENVN